MPNRLAGESSTYLLQHKDNPVDWYPWGEEAFARARAEDKPIFLSVGYSSCHWCHVMERESFEDEETAALLNASFVNIKVDREERPDVDAVYMRALQGMVGQGGWPMSIFLTPDRRPFYAGTYFPSRRHEGLPSFRDIIAAVANAYQERRNDMEAAGERVVAYLESQNATPPAAQSLSAAVLNEAFRALAAGFDSDNGGFGPSPKFPQPLVHEFLLRYWHRTAETRAVAMAELTANRIARGGIYDQLGGGFHRYATDARWLVPHFEKMLYDNALLAMLYVHLWQATGKPFLRRIVEETLAYVEREMLHPSGAFYSSQDADSEGEEGKFFTWDAAEVDRLLGPEFSRVARVYFGITDAGKFEGRNILSLPLSDEEAAQALQMSVEELQKAAQEARSRLFEAREKRPHPGIDDKAVTAWNALMLKTFAEAGAALNNPAFVRIAEENACFIFRSLFNGERLFRTWEASGDRRTQTEGYLEDYATLIDALVTLYEATFDYGWVTRAVDLADRMIDLFWDEDATSFFDTPRDRQSLIVRPRNLFDNAYPSGNSTATLALLRLALLTGRGDYESYALAGLRMVHDLMGSVPSALPRWLAALDLHLSKAKEIVIIGPRDDPATRRLLNVIHDRYLPNKIVAGAEAPPAEPPTPLLENRAPIAGRPTAFVCEDYHCLMPVTEPEGLAAQLGDVRVRT
ncbi:MAG: thioredoxin domain-containing protein [Dehalococcoidia bacterium]|jgi:uncharacterized protein YyaL (SSP411 family)